MKPQTKIDILVAAETLTLITPTLWLAVRYLGGVWALLPLAAAIGASLLIAIYIPKRILKLTWREAWAFWQGRRTYDG